MPLLVVCGSSGGATAAEKAPFGGSTAPLLPMRDSNSDRLGSSEDAAAGLEPRCTVALDEPDCSVGAGWALLVNDDRCLVRHDCLPAIALRRLLGCISFSEGYFATSCSFLYSQNLHSLTLNGRSGVTERNEISTQDRTNAKRTNDTETLTRGKAAHERKPRDTDAPRSVRAPGESRGAPLRSPPRSPPSGRRPQQPSGRRPPTPPPPPPAA